MRRIATTTCIIGALALFGALIAQGAALAQGHHRAHHASHHAKKHVKKARHAHSRSHLERLAPVTPSGSTGATGSTGTTGTTGTTGAAGEESAGKVTSFSKGVLTITLNNGTTITGVVTPETKILCESPTATMADFSGQGDRQDGSGDDDHGMGGGQENCGPSALLVSEAMVAEALVNIAPAGNTFVEIELIVPTLTTEKSNVGDDEFGFGGGGGDQQGGDH